MSSDTVPVTQADRELFNLLFRIPDRRVRDVLDGSQDRTEEMQAIARHRATPTPSPAMPSREEIARALMNGSRQKKLDMIRSGKISASMSAIEYSPAWEDASECERLSYYEFADIVLALTSVDRASEAGWMPIETAPKDGTRILVWCVHANHQYAPDDDKERWAGAVIASWTSHNGGGWTWYGHCGRFTHWRPLPEPPALSSIGSEAE